jgi:hypothetical protein
MVSRARDVDLRSLADEWVAAVGKEYGQQYEVTPDAIRAVGELVRLCQLAEQENLAVVHTWHL